MNPVSTLFADAVAKLAAEIKPAPGRKGAPREGVKGMVRGRSLALDAVAKKSGVSKNTLNRWTTGEYPVQDGQLRAWAVCNALGIELEVYHDAVAEQGRLAAAKK